MGIVEMISLTVVLLLALYGCAQLFLGAAERLYRPRRGRVLLVLPLDGEVTDAEQQIRYAQMLAKQYRLRLALVDNGVADDTRLIAQLLLRNGVGEWMKE